MRIAIISDGVHPYVLGGMQRHTFYLVKYLTKQNIQVSLFHFNQSQKNINDLEIFSENERALIENNVIEFPKGNGLPGHYVRASYQYSSIIYEKIKDKLMSFDFIYSKGFSAWKLIEEKRKGNIKCPPIGVKFHGYEMFQKQANFRSFLASRLLRNPVKWITLNADYVFSYGSKITDIIENLGVKKERIIEIPAGIEMDWLNKSELKTNLPRTFVFLGRYERRKGVEELNKAIRKLIEKQLDFKFNFIGPFESDLQINSDKVIYHGKQTENNKIKEILDSSDFLVSPSWSEGMPNVILEGMARGCAIICTNVGANSIMVDEVNGHFVKVGDVDELTKALEWAINLDSSEVLGLRNRSVTKIENKLLYKEIIEKFINAIIKIKENEKIS